MILKEGTESRLSNPVGLSPLLLSASIMERARLGKKISASSGGLFLATRSDTHAHDLKHRDLLSICINAIHAGSTAVDPAQWKVTQEMLEREIKKGRREKKEHEGEKRARKRIGFR